jgi:2-iminobutanoate/2-iminopropanoate deaminase
MERRIINPPELPDSGEYGYSHAIVADGTLYMSGQVGMDGDRELASEEITGQTRQAFENVASICRAVDLTLQDVVKVTAHVVDPHSRFEEYNAVYQEQFEAPYPCHTVLGVEQLAGPQYLVEIEAELPVPE